MIFNVINIRKYFETFGLITWYNLAKIALLFPVVRKFNEITKIILIRKVLNHEYHMAS